MPTKHISGTTSMAMITRVQHLDNGNVHGLLSNMSVHVATCSKENREVGDVCKTEIQIGRKDIMCRQNH